MTRRIGRNWVICGSGVAAAATGQWLLGIPLEIATALLFVIGLALGALFPPMFR